MIPHREALRAWLEAVPFRRRVAECLIHEGGTYLVGGSVRDALLGRQGYDLDVVVEGSAIALGRRLADALGGAFFVMDRVHDVARVIMRQEGAHYHVDLAGLRAEGIERDLRARDFTINAMAVALRPALGELLDPTGGLEDLRQGILRAAYEEAFEEDPLRVLRGVRLANDLGLRWWPATEALALGAVEALRNVSAERVRDELFNILALPSAASALGHPVGQRALPLLLPLDLSEVGPALEGLRLLEGALSSGTVAAEDSLRVWLDGYWNETLSVGRTRRQLLKLAALLMVCGEGAPQKAEGAAYRLRLSRREVTHLRLALEALEAPLWQGEGEPGPVAIYRYYRRVGEAGVNGAILAAWARPDGPKRKAYDIISAWFQQKGTLIAPEPLLNGWEIAQRLGIAPGPQVGAFLEALLEAQVAGQVRDRTEAWRYLRWLAEGT